MKVIRDQVKMEDVEVKENFKHSSQKDAARGFGGKFGVQTDRKDKVSSAKGFMGPEAAGFSLKNECLQVCVCLHMY